jgi:hypothetical protein
METDGRNRLTTNTQIKGYEIHTIRSLASSKAVYSPDNGRKPIHDPSRTIVYVMSPIIYRQAKNRATILRNWREANTG